MSTLAITGASGFIGQHLALSLSADHAWEVRILIHENKPEHLIDRKGLVPIVGDLLKPDTLRDLFAPGCTVINLAYLNRQPLSENLDAMESLSENCVKARIKRLVHCSTAVVVGGAPDDVITEETPCNPNSEYETIKFQIEGLLRDKARNHFELVILRPTAVFGPGGKNLLKLANDLTTGSKFVSYLKSCLFDSRRMNLVYVDNVVSALLFLAFTNQTMDREIFIISDDEYLENNYRDIEKYLMRHLGCKEYPRPRIPLPQLLLTNVLKLAGRSNLNPDRIYRSEKLRNAGLKKNISFEAGLKTFAEWYRKTHLPPK